MDVDVEDMARVTPKALNRFISLGVAGVVVGSVVNSTLYNGE